MPDWLWNPTDQRFETSGGDSISDTNLKRLILLLLALWGDEFVEATDRVVSGRQSIGDWQREMIGELRDLHVSVALAGFGGASHANVQDRDWISSVLRVQFGYLERFARQIEAGTRTAASQQMIAARARLYAAAADQTFEEARRRSHARAGFLYERNILGAAEHCGECVDVTEAGWVPIGTLPAPGHRTCRANCKCRLIFRREPQS